MTHRSVSMTWIWLALFRLIITLVMGYMLAHALQERLAWITRVFRLMP